MILFVYDHFYPDFSAGGPVTSLHNLAQLIKEERDVRLLTSAYVYQSGQKIQDVEYDCWTRFNGLSIWYASDRSSIKRAIEDLSTGPITLYLNGIFSPTYFLFPLWLARSKFRTIVSPRGMLQAGALRSGLIKKSAYLLILKVSGLLHRVEWHATDLQEAEDIKTNVDVRCNPFIIPNVPVQFSGHTPIRKDPGVLRLVYYSLIAEKKNLYFLLDLLNSNELITIELDIIGPVKDKAYWEKCLELIRTLTNPRRVRVKGEINPLKVRETLSGYHVLVLPTLAENFGHAIVEMLACSRPVLISNKTPWNDIEKYGGGYAMELDKQEWVSALTKMVAWHQEEFDKAARSAANYYQVKFNFDDLKMRYLKLFSNPS